jgi:hypothetical protein
MCTGSPGHSGDQLAAAVDDPRFAVGEFDGDGLPGAAEADLDALAGDLDALAGDLDAAATEHLPLDGQARLRERVWPGAAGVGHPFARIRRQRG